VTASANRKYILFGVFMALSLALDQWTKSLAREFLKGRAAKTVVQHYFDLRYSENPGVAFGMLQQLPGGRLVLTLLAVLAFVLVIAYLRKTEAGASRVHVALGLVGGGALGNVYDRVVYGRVTDFIVWHVKLHEWPAFNIADAALCVGVGLLMLDMFLSRPEKSTTPASSA
jgi:signal peptidase II